MKPQYIAFLIAVAFALWAKASFDGIHEASQTKEAEATSAENAASKSTADLNTAKGRLEQLSVSRQENEQFLKAWQSTFGDYSRVTEVTAEARKKHNVQVIMNSPANSGAEISMRFAGHSYNASRRIYAFTGKLADCINYFGAFEERFELMQTQQINIVRKGDLTQCEILFAQPQFENFN